MTIGIYMFTNNINGMSYIGQSTNIERRYKEHMTRNGEKTFFHKELRKYGKENFSFSILEECLEKDLNCKEMHYIYIKKTLFPYGYNISAGVNIGRLNKLEGYNCIEEIKEILKNNEVSMIEIGKMYGISDQTVSDINNGRIWFDDRYDYPIRKKKKKSYSCSLCGKKLNSKTKTGYCKECYNKSNRKSDRPSKEHLYFLLNINSFEAVGRMYNVSSAAIKKWCDNYGIPRNSSYYKKLMIKNAL